MRTDEVCEMLARPAYWPDREPDRDEREQVLAAILHDPGATWEAYRLAARTMRDNPDALHRLQWARQTVAWIQSLPKGTTYRVEDF